MYKIAHLSSILDLFQMKNVYTTGLNIVQY